MIKVQLTADQRIEIENFRRQASSKDSEKALMVLMSADGQSVAEVASTLRRNPHTVRDWLKRYKKKGLTGIYRKFSPGRPDEKRKKVKERIEKIVTNPPTMYGYMDNVWTVSLLAHDIRGNLKISVSNDTVIRALKNMEYSYKRPSKTVPPRAPSREEKITAINKMVSDIKKIIGKEDSIIYALDESHFSTEPYLIQGWFKKRWPPWDTNMSKERKSHILWMLESEKTKILLEKIKQIE
jgi:transposase